MNLHVQLSDNKPRIFIESLSSDTCREQVLNIAGTLDKVLSSILLHPHIRVKDVDCFSERDMQQIRKWNSGPLEQVRRCVHEVIEDQVLAQPKAEAVCAWDCNFTYGELSQLATRLARRLKHELGVGPEIFVPICMDKSAWYVVAVLAVIKAGGAFVPLDPAHPLPRLQALARSVGATVLLCSRQHVSRLATVTDVVLPVDAGTVDQRQLAPSSSMTDGQSTVTFTNAAYLIFTSGTTGEPKGTVVEHSAFCSSAKAHGPAMLMRSDSRVLQFAAHTFDASLVEILTTLTLGACVCIPDENVRLNSIATAIQEMRVDWAVLTPSFMKFIEPSTVPGLKTLTLAGEAMSQDDITKWSRINLVNGYGPSECAVAAVVNSRVLPKTDPKNIGLAVGVHCWVADQHNHDRLVPVGCIGELLLEGPSLARGYLNEEEKSLEAFIKAPAWARTEGPTGERWRMYKTGDLVRYNFDGTLNFVGRKDTQVKVHGQRVELGEIEHHLGADSSTRHSMVLLPSSGYFKGRLVSVLSLSDTLVHDMAGGDCVQDPAEEATSLKIVNGAHKERHTTAIRERLSDRLPEYMVPSTCLVVESFPFLTSGKLDRKGVAKWIQGMSEDLYRQVTSTSQTAERSYQTATETEFDIRLVWAHVLNLSLEQVKFDHPFLSFGGDSISAMQVMGQCRKKGISLKLQDILRSKSITQLAHTAQALHRPSYHDEAIETAFDLSPIQHSFFNLPNQGKGHFNQSFSLRITRPTSEEDIRNAIEALIERHSMLRARFYQSDVDGKWQQRVTKELTSSYRFRTHKVSTQDQATPEIADSQACLDASNGPMFAADLFDVNGNEQLLFMVAHHLVVDLVSWRVILEDVEEMLQDPRALLAIERPMPFQTWCLLQADHSAALPPSQVYPDIRIPPGDAAYWGMADRPNTYGDVMCNGFEVDSATTSLVLKGCHKALRTDTVDILVSALIHSFSQAFTDRAVPAVYNEGHGREPWDPALDISRTVGWFTVMYPIHVSTSNCDNPIETVRLVKDLRRQVPSNGRQYFASRCLTPAGKEMFSHHRPLEVVFNYLGQYQQLEREEALLKPIKEMAGEARGAGGTADVGIGTPRFGLFEISAVVVQGRLRFSFTFNRHMRHQDGIQRWIASCKQILRMIAESLTYAEHEATLSDFPLLSLTYEDLKTMMTEKLPQLGVSGIDDVEDVYPCSPMQQGLLLSQSRSSAYYAVEGVYEVKAETNHQIDSQRLADSWQNVIDRHAALRTVFIENTGGKNSLYSQVVLKHAMAHVLRLEAETSSEARNILAQHQPSSYDDGRRPPHRFTICQTRAGEMFCKLEISHVIMDGASMSLIFRDLELAYGGQLSEDKGPLYSDYVDYLLRQPLDAGTDYWMSYLTGVEPCYLPTLTDGVPVARHFRSLRIDFQELKELQEFSNTSGITLSSVMHSAWALTLLCFCGSEEVSFGYLTSGRDAPVNGIQDAVGPFINMLVCRVKTTDTGCLKDILLRVQKDYIDSVAYRHTSLAEVQHALKLSGAALFNTALSYRKLPMHRQPEPSAVSFVECTPAYDPTEYNVSINIEASEDSAIIDLDYWTDCISDSQAASVASTFVQSLLNVIHCSNQTLRDLNHLTEGNRQRILSWNSEMPETINVCVHEMFEHQAQLRPEAEAVSAWDATFSYGQLDDHATRLAHHLVSLGVAPETLIPLCFDKSAWTIVAMLGVLKAGGVCVPLDATHPKSRLEARARDTQAQIVLAAPTRVAVFQNTVRHVVAVSQSLLDGLPAIEGRPCSTVQPANACFVIYTSGSTGQPKGVVLEHRALTTSAEAHGSVLGIGQKSRVLQFAAYTFDNHLEEILTTLMRGGCVCVPSDHDRLNNLVSAMNKFKVNFADFTPTVARFLQPAEVPMLKGLALGGEPLTKSLTEVWGNVVSLHSQYGPSECSINCTWNGNVGHCGEATNIGRAIGSVSWVVNPSNHDRLIPIGCTGELLVEGPILARGYLNDPRKTRESFITDPAWAIRAQNATSQPRRMYKTGDLVRYNSDGTITFIGRKDSQVKLNGQRIELGEIEYHIKANLSIETQSAVELLTTNDTQRVTKALAVFLHFPHGSELGDEEGEYLLPVTDVFKPVLKALEATLLGVLPAYMVPSIYILVSGMPLTSSGKLDRRKLRNLCQSLSAEQMATYRLAGVGGLAPSTDMEKSLQKLWESVLKLPAGSVSADDSFFRLGGDSIGAIQLVTAARSKGISLSVASIFQTPKLNEMARNVLVVADATQLNAQAVTVQPAPTPFALLKGCESLSQLIGEIAIQCEVAPESVQDIYPCTPMQEGLIALSSKLPGAYVAHSIYHLSEDVDLDRFRQAWEAVVQAESILRTRIVYTKTSGFLQVVVQEPISWHKTGDLQQASEEDRRIPTHNGGALTRFTIAGEDTGSRSFVWTAHHALYDGWSMSLLLNRVEACYRMGSSADLAPCASYRDFISYLSELNSAESDSFWRSRLSGAASPQFPRLPSPAYQVSASRALNRNAHISRVVGSEITIASTIRAAWALTVAIYSGSDDVVFGEALTGRDAPVPGIANMIGPTFTAIPKRISVNRELSIREYLQDIQEQSAAAIVYQHAGLHYIKRLSPDTAMACEFQNLITVNHQSDNTLGSLFPLRDSGTKETNFYTYPLMISCNLSDSGVDIDADYDENIISTWQLDRLLHQFEFILTRLTLQDAENEKLGELELLTSWDRETILDWNSDPSKTLDKCIHHVIEEQLDIRSPSTMAVYSWDAQYTYAELDKLAARLAHHLVNRGTGPEVFVAVCFEKSSWMIIAILAVLKAGGAFVPLDPTDSAARLHGLVADIGAQIVLCSPRYHGLCENLGAQVLSVGPEMIDRLPIHRGSLPPCASNNTAYVLFTPGTVEMPKGAQIEHIAFCTAAAAYGNTIRIKHTSRVLQLSPYTYDTGVIEILTTLMSGGCVCVPSEDDRLDPARIINDMRVNWALLTPSLAKLIEPSAVRGLQTLVLSGEPLSENQIATWSREVDIISAYNSSECAGVMTVNPHPGAATDSANIGRAVAGRCWIVDPHNHHRLMPIGGVGELLFEGPTLARGYVNHSYKTAEVFIETPKWALEIGQTTNAGGRRMFKTGDLVKYARDGTLIFVGRKDTPIAVAAVQHHLMADPLVQHAITIVPTSGPCKKQPVAVLSLQKSPATSDKLGALQTLQAVNGQAVSSSLSDIRQRLCRRLAAHMIPSNWVVLQRFPLLPSGKLDRRWVFEWLANVGSDQYCQLSCVRDEAARVEDSDTESKDDRIEHQLRLIWSYVLNMPLEEVEPNLSFLYLGGDSISAMQVVARCREESIGVTVQDIIQAESISELASRASLQEQCNDEAKYQDEETEQAFELSPIQRLYFQSVGNDWAHFNQSILLRLTRKTDPKDLERAITAVVKAHSMLRARFSKDENSVWWQRIPQDISSSYSFQVHREIGVATQRIQGIVKKSQTSLDIQNGPVFAADLVDFGAHECQILSLVAHHLVIDVVSWRIILDELEGLLRSGTASTLSSLPFQSWCRLQVEHAQGRDAKRFLPLEEVPVADLAYWGMDGKANTYGDTVSESFEFNAESTALLLGPCNNALRTEPVDIFIASIIHSFQNIFRDRAETPAIYNEGHGREVWDAKLDLSKTVGWFTTLCPVFVPSKLDDPRDIVDIIRWIKDFRRAVPGKGMPYFEHRLLTPEGKERFAKHWPMEIGFNYLGVFQQLERTGALLQQADGLFEQPTENLSDIGPNVPRFALIEISATVIRGSVRFSFDYNRHMKYQADIRRWVAECERSLRTAAERLSQMKPESTLSDFPLLPLRYNGLAKLIEKLPRTEISSLEEVEDAYPCSPIQQGMLLSQLKAPEYYTYQATFEVRGTGTTQMVDIKRFAEAWQDVVRRHAALRTLFVSSEEGTIDQVVVKKAAARIVQLDCDDTEVLTALAKQQPIDCSKVQPPHRITVCKTSSGRVFCKFDLSHAICDGTSIPILLRDLAQAYKGKLSTEEKGPLFSDYLAYTQQHSREADLGFWKGYLEGIEPCYFPVLNDGVKDLKELQSLELELPDVSKLQAFCAKNSVTLSNVLQFVWALVVRCYTGSNEVCFGYLTSGRDLPVSGIEDAVGLFVNMLICRVNFTDGLQLGQALKQVQTDYVRSAPHQLCSLAEVQHELHLAGISLFNTAFTFQRRSSSRDITQPALHFDLVEVMDPNEYDISVNVEAYESNVSVQFSYWTDKLSQAQAKNVASTFGHALSSIVRSQNHDQAVAELDLFSEHSRQQVLNWNGNLPEAVNTCMHEMIQRQTLLRPASTPAVCAWDASLTYLELETLATRLAISLRRLGVGPEVYVPLLFEKSVWAIVAMIGVLKAGGAFVPLDPSHPATRLKWLISNVGSMLVLCSSKHQEKASRATEATFVVSSEAMNSLPNHPNDLSSVSVTPENAAYIIFTSGTTGQPKGTIVEHGSICTSSTEHSKAMFMRSSSRVLQFSSYTFDASIMEILTTLFIGGCVCVPSDEDRMNNLPAAIERMRANWMLLTPSVASVIKPESVPSLQVLVTGGEAMSADLIKRWSGTVALVNAYGPTEAAVVATVSVKVDEEKVTKNTDPANIGRVLAGRGWLVDPNDHNRLVPVGSVGELVIEGRVVARGYLNNAQKTADAFLNKPTWLPRVGLEGAGSKHERMYKTGDLMRYHSDGTLGYVARKDTQIKLNGQRIELGEIEHHVKLSLPETSQAAVDLIEFTGRITTKALAVFFTVEVHADEYTSSKSTPDPSTGDELLLSMSDAASSIAQHLKASLTEALPAYMVPSFFVPISRLPWTNSAKLDRPRLRNMVRSLSKGALAPYRLANSIKRAPEIPMEKKLVKLWETVLNLDVGSVGKEDNFFGMGGDSISAMRLVAAAHSGGIALTVLSIFQNPKLSEMAGNCTTPKATTYVEPKAFAMLDNSEAIDELVVHCQVNKESIIDAYPCSSLQEGLITLSTKQPGAYVARNVFRLFESVDIQQFKNAWQRAVDEMDILRTRVVQTSSDFLQAVLRPHAIKWHTSKSLQSVLDEEMRLPAYDGGPLTRYTIVDGGEPGACYFVWAIHHALYDGWSMSMILQRVKAIYSEDSLPPYGHSYARFVRYLGQNDLSSSDKFWKSKLSGAAPTHFPQPPRLLSDRVRNSQTLTHTARFTRDVSLTDITVSTVIRAAWSMIIAAHSGSDDTIFGEVLVGRDIPVPGITDVVGPTLATVPTRIHVDRGSTIMNFLQTLQLMAAERMPHQHAGLQRIKRLNPATSVACDFQNLLVVQTAGERDSGELWELQSAGSEESFFTHPLVIECTVNNAEAEINAYFEESTISTWQVQRLLHQFESVIKQLGTTSKPNERRLGDVQIFSPEDQEMVRTWNDRKLTLVDRCIHDLFEQQALRQPDSPAVCAWDRDLTYAEVKEYATRLAHAMIKRGVRPEGLVPICMDKSAWTVIAILGVLIAGGAYVPLSPAHPVARNQEIVRATNATVLLCSPQHRHCYTQLEDQGCTVISVDAEMVNRLPTLDNISQPLSPVTSRNAAYVIYTSGSTGKPKGVVMEHRAFCTSSAAFCSTLHLRSTSRVFQFASYTFDASVMEVLSTLTAGGCVCIPSEDMRMGDIAGAINRMKANWTFLTPSVANVIDPDDISSLEVLVCGGEALSPETVAKWAEKVSLMNGYGPTETCIFSVANPTVTAHARSTNIGWGLEGGYTWIVDPFDHGRLAPLGAVGELLVEGPILARGYLNDEGITAAAFIENPTWATVMTVETPERRRMYKTGDLVRYNADGTLEYIGRKDNQLKLNGQRLELGEIENHLVTNPKIRHALVAMPKSGPCKQRLVAILSLSDARTRSTTLAADACRLLETKLARTEAADVRHDLTNKLPPYMVPAIWLVVETIPMLVSGKLDRTQVTRWVEGLDRSLYERIMNSEDENDSAVLVTATGRRLQQIWSRVLNLPVETVKVNQPFLSLGGDSITAMQVMAQCRKEGIHIALRDILRSRSIVQLATTARSGATSAKTNEKIGQVFELSPIQQLYFHLTGNQEPSDQRDDHFNQSFLLRPTRQLEPQMLRRAIEVIVGRHPMLRALFDRSQSGAWQQRIHDDIGSSFRYRVHSVGAVGGIAPVTADSQKSLDIRTGPLLAVDLFNVKEDCQAISLIAHHLVVDTVSWRIILQELEDILRMGEQPFESALSFQAWCTMQAEHSRRQSFSDINNGGIPSKIAPPDLMYWALDGQPNTYSDVDYESFTVNESITAAALGECHKAYRTEPVDLFLSAIAHSFRSVFSDRESPAVFNESHGRESWDSTIDLTRTVGWFTTIYPVCVSVDAEGDDVLETVRRIKDTRHRIAENGRPYFAKSLLAPEGQQDFKNHMPIEIIFNYLGRMQQLERDDSLLQQMDSATGKEGAELTSDVGPDTPRFGLFEISAAVMDNKIQFTFMYNRRARHQQRIQLWITECQRTLEKLVKSLIRCPVEPTLSDFPLLPSLSREQSQKLANKTFPQIGISSLDEVEDIYPCAPMQEGLLLAQLRDPAYYLFHAIFEVKPLRVGMPVDPQRLARAWQKVVNRHAALRTVFIDGFSRGIAFNQLVVKYADSGVLSVRCDDSERHGKLNSITLNDANSQRRTPLPHLLTVCETSSGKSFVKLEMNHAVIDGTSIGVLLHDLTLAYEGRLPHENGPLYSDYIAYISNDSDVHYWTTYLQQVRPCLLSLPKSNLAAAHDKRQGSVRMDFDRYSELQEVCRSTNVTLSNVMQAAWALVLRIYTGSDDVCFGYLTSGRDAPIDKIHEAVGAFINMLVCRVKFSSTTSLEEVFRKANNDYLESLPHQHCSLARIQHELKLSGQALFNTAMSIQNPSAAENGSETPAFAFEPVDTYDPNEYAVTVNISTERNQEGVVVRYWTDILSDNQAADLTRTFAQVLTDVVTQPGRTIAEMTTSGIGSGLQALSDSRSGMMQQIVKDCVREIIEQMFKTGELVRYNPSSNITVAPENAQDSDAMQLLGHQARAKDKIGKLSVDAVQSKIRTPSDHVKEKLRSLWSVLLDLPEDSIASDDSFFQLGGDSIAAMSLVGAARDEGLSITVADVFRHPRLSELAELVDIADDASSHQTSKVVIDYQEVLQAKSSTSNHELYQRFSLLKTTNVEVLLQNTICPKVHTFRGGILDVFPVTDFQALAVTGALLESRWMLNYFYLDGRGALDLRRLKQSAFQLVQAFDILRTVFVHSGDRFLQVVLRKFQPEFTVCETDSDLDTFTTSLQESDRQSGPQLGEAYVQFKVVRQKGSDRHRIILRLSHAQYDGVCMPKILAALQAGYDDQPIPAAPAFSDYVRLSAGAIASDHYDHWSNLLKGSAMTDIVHREGPKYNRGVSAPTTLKKVVHLASLASHNITPATVIKAAWSFVLAQLSGRSDTIFGHVISGRNAGIPGIENIIGPCLNIVPVRTKFQPGGTVLDLFRSVQEQQVANMPFEWLGFREIIQKCTDWPKWTNFTTVVQHQNVSRVSRLSLGRNTYDVGAVGSQDDFADFAILSTPQDPGKVELNLTFTVDNTITMPFAETVFSKLCATVHEFSASPQTVLSSPADRAGFQWQTLAEASVTSVGLPSLSSNLHGLSKNDLLLLSDILTRAWRQVLRTKQAGFFDLALDSSFFDLGGDIIGLAQIATLLEEEGFHLRVEDLLDHQTMGRQLALLAAQKTKEGVAGSERGSERVGTPEVAEEVKAGPRRSGWSGKWGKSIGLARKTMGRVRNKS